MTSARDALPTGPAIVVVGGGVAGAAAAYALRKELPDARITVLEAAPTVGGKLASAEVGGLTVDVGAEAMLNRRPEAVGLAREVGLELVHPATTSSALWNRGVLRPMPRTLMGVPGDLTALAHSKVISAAGLTRARLDLVLPASHVEEDVSIGHLVEERLGGEIVDRLVEPLLGGVYAGHAREISARAAVPQVVALLDRDRSLVRAAGQALAAAQTGAPAGPSPVFAGLRGGVARLVPAVLAAAGVEVRTGTTVRDLARRPAGGWRLVTGSVRDPALVEADAVVLATPARASARLLADVAPSAALELARIDYASMAIVTLAFPAEGFPDTDGSGFLVPPVDGHAIKAATLSFAKWDWVREDAGGLLVLRASIGRHREEQVLQVSDDELAGLALADLAAALGPLPAPVDRHVQRWGGALPQYAVGHRGRVALIRRYVDEVPGIAVCGAAYDGIGVPACIASARLAVAKITTDLAAVPEAAGGE